MGSAPRKMARLIGPAPGDWLGDARVYALYPPTERDDTGGVSVAHVVVSAAVGADLGPVFEPEVVVYGCDKRGENVDYVVRLRGSYRGGLDHAEALRGLGYEIETSGVARG